MKLKEITRRWNNLKSAYPTHIQAPRAGDDDGIPPPSSVSVDAEPLVVLYGADGTPLKRQIGFSK